MKLCHCSHVGTTILIQNCKQSQACRVRTDVPVPPGTLPPGLQAVLQIQLVQDSQGSQRVVMAVVSE